MARGATPEARTLCIQAVTLVCWNSSQPVLSSIHCPFSPRGNSDAPTLLEMLLEVILSSHPYVTGPFSLPFWGSLFWSNL